MAQRLLLALAPHCLSLLFCLLCFSSCALPGHSATSVSLSGQLLGSNNQPLPGKTIIITLPASYGLNDIDLSFGDAEEYSHTPQSAALVTDALGSFSYSFKPVTYSRFFWIIPPLGSLFSSPPEPFFFLSFPEKPQERLSVLVSKEKAELQLISASGARLSGPDLEKKAGLAASGRLFNDQRGELEGLIAELQLHCRNCGAAPEPR